MNISLDIETQGLKINTEIHYVGAYTVNKQGKECFIMFELPNDVNKLKSFISNRLKNKDTFTYHNGKFDTVRLLYSYGIDLPIHHDTMILGYLDSTVDELKDNRKNWLSLKTMANRYLGISNWDIGENKMSRNRKFVEPYLFKDCKYTYKLWELLINKISKEIIPTYYLIIKALNAYKYIENNGLPIDMSLLEETKLYYTEKQTEVNKQLKDIVQEYMPMYKAIVKSTSKLSKKELLSLEESDDINWNSTKQVQNILFMCMNMPIIDRTPSGQPALGVHTLKELQGQHEIIDYLLTKREVEKALTFITSWKEEALQHKDGCYYLHPNFNLHGTVTGRTSCDNPNLQQIPRNKKLKSLFRATNPDYEMVCLDFSQLELRTAAIVADIKNMKDAYRHGIDLHKLMASKVAGCKIEDVTKDMRTKAKAANFGFLYGMQAPSFVKYAKDSYGTIVTLEEAQLIRESFFEMYPELLNYYDKVRRDILDNQYETSMMRRVYKINPEKLSNKWERENYIRPAINFPVQSAGSDYVLCGLIKVLEEPQLKNKFYVGASVHDSIIGLLKKDDEFYDNIELIRSIMQHNGLANKYITKDIDIPIIVDEEIGPLGLGVDIQTYREEHINE